MADVTTPTAPGDAPGPPPEPRRGNLAPIALALGIPGLLLGLVPFYGTFFALPLSVAAVVLGLTARGRPEEHRGQATGGLVTGALGLLLVVGWIAWMGFNQLGLGSYASQTAVEVEAGTESSVAVPAPDAPTDQPPGEGDDTVTVAPGADEGELHTGLSGEAQVVIGGESSTMELTDCALSRASSRGVLVRASGPDGRIAVTRSGSFHGGLVVAVDSTDEPAGTYTGDERGMSGRGSSGGLVQRHRFTLEGSLRDVHDGQEVDADIEVTCR